MFTNATPNMVVVDRNDNKSVSIMSACVYEERQITTKCNSSADKQKINFNHV